MDRNFVFKNFAQLNTATAPERARCFAISAEYATFAVTYWIHGKCKFILGVKSGKFSYISKFHIIISCKLIVYIVMCFYQETN